MNHLDDDTKRRCLIAVMAWIIAMLITILAIIIQPSCGNRASSITLPAKDGVLYATIIRSRHSVQDQRWNVLSETQVFIDHIGIAAKQNQVPREVLQGVLDAEWSPYVDLVHENENGSYDTGPAQINSSTVEYYRARGVVFDLTSYEASVAFCALHLRFLYHATGFWFSAVQAYNAGLRGVSLGRGWAYAMRIMEVVDGNS